MISSATWRWCKAARDEAGPEVDLMVDAGWFGAKGETPFKTLALKDWIRLVRELEELDVFWLEDFLHPENFAGYAEVAGPYPHPAHRRRRAAGGLRRVRAAGGRRARRTCCSPTCRAAAG